MVVPADARRSLTQPVAGAGAVEPGPAPDETASPAPEDRPAWSAPRAHLVARDSTMAVQDASINAEDLETSMHVLGNAHAPVGPGEHHDGGAREYVDQPCCTNCLISTALAVILCRKRCDPGRVVSEFAFFPPDPPTYALGKGDGDAPPTVDQPGVGSLRFNYRELDGDPHFARFRNLDGAHGRPSCRLLFTRRKQKIPCFFFERPGASLCVLYLHANATDCGAMLPTVWKSNLQLYFNVSVCECFDTRTSAVLRELDESNRFIQKSAESTSI